MNYPDYSIGGVLIHHGIQGQKWGKRNGPPYPLKPGDHSAAENKASKGRSTGSASEAKKKTIKKPVQGNIKRYVDNLFELRRDAINNHKKYKKAVKWEKEYMKEFNKRRSSGREFRDVDKEINDLLEKRGLEKPPINQFYRQQNELNRQQNELNRQQNELNMQNNFQMINDQTNINNMMQNQINTQNTHMMNQMMMNQMMMQPLHFGSKGSTKKLLTDKQRENGLFNKSISSVEKKYARKGEESLRKKEWNTLANDKIQKSEKDHYGFSDWLDKNHKGKDYSIKDHDKFVEKYYDEVTKPPKELTKYKNGEDYWKAIEKSNEKRAIAEFSNLQRKIEQKSGDWYNAKAVTKDFERYIKEDDRLRNQLRKYRENRDFDNPQVKILRNKINKNQDNWAGQVLKDLGYPDTKKNREWIYPAIFWD